jgi:integrase/recombinase XerD
MGMTIEEAAARFERRCRAKSLSARTLQFYKAQFVLLRRYLDAEGLPHDIDAFTRDVIRGYIATRHRISAYMAKQAYSTFNVLFRFLVDNDLIDASPMVKIERPRLPKKLIATFSPDQNADILRTCSNDFLGLRDRAILMIMIDCGLRANEICLLTLDHVDLDERVLRVWGKGNKARLVPFGNATRQALRDYLHRRPPLATQQVFVSGYGFSLLRTGLWKIVHRRCTLANISGVRCSPHTFRHTFAVMYLRNGGDVFTLQKLLGHTDLTMTRRYAELSDTDVRNKHRACSPGDQFLAHVPPATRTRIR